MDAQFPNNWFFIIGGDTSRAWATLPSAYVSEWPEHGVTRLPSETAVAEALAPYGIDGPVVAPSRINAEAQRRIVARVGASDFNGCIVKQLNALMRATELANKRASGATLTEAETAQAAGLQAMADAISLIRAKANAFTVPIPSDFRDDTHWS